MSTWTILLFTGVVYAKEEKILTAPLAIGSYRIYF